MVIIDNFYLFLIYVIGYVTPPAIAKHMRAGHNWNVGIMGFGEDGLLITSILTG